MLHDRKNRRIAVALAALAAPFAAVHCQDATSASAPPAGPVGTAYVNQFYPVPATVDKARLLFPTNLEYKGAFRLPTAPSAASTFTYVSGAMTYFPKGDSKGAEDGFPGSLFAVGHVGQMDVAEVDIPKPALPNASKSLSSLPTARILTPFMKIGTRPSGANPVVAIAYMPAQGSQTADKLYVAKGDGYLPEDDHKQYWISDLDGANQSGPYSVGADAVHCYSDYIFQVPKSWSDRYAPGMRLVTGRHREGDLCGRGPAFFGIAPWADGNPPALDKPLSAKPMLRYKQEAGLMNYSRGGDVYMDGAFLEAPGKSAIVMVGQKGLSDGEYGTYCSYQGFHDLAGYRPYLIFYDPEEIGKAAKGEIALDKPMPYAGIDLNEYMMKPNRTTCDKNGITAAAYDAERGHLYLLERFKESPVVHVFSLNGGIVGARRDGPAPSLRPAIAAVSGARDAIRITLPAALQSAASGMKVTLLAADGREVAAAVEGSGATRELRGLREGLYLVKVTLGAKTFMEKVFLSGR